MKYVILVLAVMGLAACAEDGDMGPRGYTGAKGERGEIGPVGPRGEDGAPGQSCSVVKLGTVTNITCGETTVQVTDGVDGSDGVDGADAVSPGAIETLALCPSLNGGSFKEYLLRLPSGEILAVYSANGNVGLSKLAPGSYVTTDGRNCHFTVTAQGTVQ